MSKIYDVSAPVFPGMAVYKNKPEKQPNFETTSNGKQSGVHETRVHMDVHTGTHVDAPLHMLEDGATIDSIPLQRLIGACRVIELLHVNGGIGRADLEPHHIQAGEFLFLKTKNSFDEAFNPEFTFVAEDGADYLAALGVAGVAIDGLGIERSQPGHPTHKALFARDVVIIEGVRLADVPAGSYQFFALPVRLIGLDASPARIVLIED
jgi:arylformamidase